MSAHYDTNRLAILIPTIPSRRKLFMALLHEVNNQIRIINEFHSILGKVEAITLEAIPFAKGGPSIGQNRQALIEKASAFQFLCFLDDDESISPNYVETILRMIWDYEQKFHIIPDICTFRSIVKLDNFWALVDMDLNNPGNEQIKPIGITLRKPWHICPVRTELAQQFKFPDSNYGEDWVWFEKVMELCKNQAHTDSIIHQYNHSMKTSMADNVTTAKLD